jgi:glyoxylase-like metal-dependent hydrolase (beta-lactamase superfamily II)
MENIQYIIGDTESRFFWMVDPAWEAEALYDRALNDGLSLSGILLTHAHFDHMNAVPAILRRRDVPVYAQKSEIEFMKSGVPKELFPDLPIPSLKLLSPGDRLSLGSVTASFLHTPGHTPGSQCIRVGDNLISGDTLFLEGCGRTDLPGGDPRAMFESLAVLAKLPGAVRVHPGHAYSKPEAPDRLDDLLRKNRQLKARTPAEFLSLTGY